MEASQGYCSSFTAGGEKKSRGHLEGVKVSYRAIATQPARPLLSVSPFLPISNEMLLLFHPGSLSIKINTTLIPNSQTRRMQDGNKSMALLSFAST